jgi:coenzyme Q-binding protein COQ10
VITRISDSRRLFHGADDLYDLVSDVRRYPEFISHITAMRVLKSQKDGARIDLTAEARVRFKFVSESFTTRVHGDREARSIDVSFVSGPFRTLKNKWGFHALSDGSTQVEFHIVAAFKNPVMQMLLDSNRERAAKSMIGRFSNEANGRYQTAGDPDLNLDEEISSIQMDGIA